MANKLTKFKIPWTRIDSKSEMADKLTKFKIMWTRLQTRCSVATAGNEFTLPYALKSVIESSYVKDTFLLSKISSLLENIKDDLMTKEDFSYE